MAGSAKLLQFVRDIFQATGIYPPPLKKRSKFNKKNKFFLICLALLTVQTVAFLLFEAKSMFDYGFTFFIITCLINAIVCYASFVWHCENLFNFIANCEGFIAKRVNASVEYIETIEKIKLFTQIFTFGVLSGGAFVILHPMPYTIIKYYIQDVGEESFYLFYPVWYPFNWRTPFTYWPAYLYQCLEGVLLLTSFLEFLNLVFGSCWLFIFVAEDITKDSTAFNDAIKYKDGAKLTKQFCDLVQIYVDAKQCIMECNHILEYSILSFLLYILLALASTLAALQFQLWDDSSSLAEILPIAILPILLVEYAFIICEPGMMMTHQYDVFGEHFCRCDWYLLPIALQRMYLIFLSDTQNPMKLVGYGGITCERDTSKRIINNSFTYFMMLRQFEP